MYKTEIADAKSKLNALRFSIASLFLFSSFQLQAADIEKEFFLNTDVTRLSNPNLVDTNKTPVTVLRVAPEFNLTVASELNKYYLRSLLSVFRNSNEDVLPNRENPSINAGWERTLATGLFGIQASYIEDVAITQLLTTAGTAAGNSSGNEIKTKIIGANWEHDFNSRFSMINKLSYSDISFSENTAALVGFSALEGSSRVLYHNSETMSTYGQLGLLHFEPDSDISKTKISRARLGAILIPTDGMKVDANAGYYKATGPSSFDGVEAEVLASYEKDRINYNFRAVKLVSPTGLNQVQKNITFVLGAKYLLTDVSAIGTEFNHTVNKTAQTTIAENQDIRSKSILAFYEYALKDWKLRANARYLQLDNGINKPSANEIGFTVIYGRLGF